LLPVDASGVALEISVVLIGVAAACNFADQLLGATSGWRRSELAAMRLNEMLTLFSSPLTKSALVDSV